MTTPHAMTNPYAPPRAAVKDVSDPHTPAIQADRGTRLGAQLLDTIIFAGMVYLPLIVTAIVGGMAAGRANGVMTGNASTVLAVGGLLTIGGLLTWAVLTIKYVRANGQSIAKRMLGIKVVRADGSPISLGRLFWMRNVLNTLIAFIPVYGIVDALFIFTESRQCLHDKLADTIVVNA